MTGSPQFADVDFDNILKCVHCGLCLDACPTYRELGTEQDSPRGRLYLMRGLWEGELPLDENVIQPLSRCLDCRACETACPSGVPYGELLEKTRGVIHDHTPQPLPARLARTLLGRGILIHSGRLALSAKLAWVYQRLGLPRLITQTPLRKLLPHALVQAHVTMPRFDRKPFKENYQTPPEDNRPAVALFSGCIMDVAETQIHRATVRLLEAAGYRVQVPKAQVCCGALLVHDGMRETGRKLALKNLAAFKGLDVQAIIVNSAGCGAQLNEYHHLFKESPNPLKNGPGDGLPVRDLLDFLAESPGFTKSALWRGQSAFFYDAPCHLIHAQRIDKSPRALLAQIPGLQALPLADAERCCGAAGIYNLKQPELANQILDRKLDDIEDSLKQHPHVTQLVTANPGCLLQLRAGVARRKLPLTVLHPAELLANHLAAEPA